ncbi:protein of unknown function [Granulicella pectinivorans]|jgi:hypothetical protein|uniref:DUF4112 domain-containing protein n=1 Tax=Granulicella pectinivorans TaxID=474950 RepID=A0A1I6LWB1_9BACT|nr:DUF4112 domain-containing protein [Granulicella pectinivorans]SFS07562.1 protein of unknown function [Granulicella pectinivorans]
MIPAVKPEILSPRMKRAGGLASDENLDFLSHLLDDYFKIPGTTIRFGLDGIIGFIPGFGDIAGGVASCIIIIAAWLRGVSYVTITRMVVNVGIEAAVGAVPVLGNLFDIGWKANRRNYALLTGSLQEPVRQKQKSWLFLAVLCVTLALLLILPVLALGWILLHLGQAIGADLHRISW